MPKIIIDHRERSSGIIKELIKHKIEVEEKQLATADFIIQTKSIDDNVSTIGIERKTQIDFINSIIDKRIIQQLKVLKENFTVPLLIIEGSENIYSLRNFHPNAIRGMLASIAIDYQVPILHTKNYRDTASLLVIIAKRLEKPKKLIGLLKKRKPLDLKEQQELIVEGFPGVGPSLAKNLLKRFGSIKNIINSDENKLRETEKIGPKKAKMLKEIIERVY